MKNSKLIIKISKILFPVFASLMVLVIIGYDAMVKNSSAINEALNITTYKSVDLDPDPNYDAEYFKSDYKGDLLGLEAAAAAVGREIEGEGLVMLKNNGALPLDQGDQISLFFKGSASLIFSMTGSGSIVPSPIPPGFSFDTLKDALEAGNYFGVNKALWDYYAARPNIGTGTVGEASWAAVSAANSGTFNAYGDVAILTISRLSGEGVDPRASGSDGEGGGYLSITPDERSVLEGLSALKGTVFSKIIVLLNTGAPLQVDFLKAANIDVDACLWIGYLGKTGVHGVVGVLKGAVNPSGRSSDTFCYDNFSSPAMASWVKNANRDFAQRYSNWQSYGLGSSQQYYAAYVEGIYVGYRYYETRYEDYVLGKDGAGNYDYYNDVAYPFGYGESYTRFEYSNFAAEAKGNKYEISVTVKNAGEFPGKEVVQIYLQKPYDSTDGVEKASVELVGFAKTKILAANGGEETVKITVDKETFKSYDAETAKTFIMSKGDYYLAVGYNAHDAINNILAAKPLTAQQKARMTAGGEPAFASKVLSLTAKDSTTYSKSVETGKAITNQLDFADINRYEHKGSNSVRYVSRSNWTGTWPTAAVTLSISGEKMLADLAIGKPLPSTKETSPKYNVQKGLNLVMMRGLGYNDLAWQDLLNQMTYEEQALLLSNAMYGTDPLASVGKPGTKAQDGPVGIKGSVTNFSSFPSENIWASSFNLDLIAKLADIFAEDILATGYQEVYAPGANMHRSPYGGRSAEYFSEDPVLSGLASISAVKSLQAKGVIPTIKHYAFNDAESQRAGISIWLNEQAAREIYLLPFEYAMRPSMGNSHGVMTSFNRAGCIWTSASPELMITILRNEWDFDGYSITDYAGFEHMVHDDAIMNGTDLFLISGSKTALASYKSNFAFRNRVREATHRVLYVTANYSASMNGETPTSKIVIIMPWWQVVLIVGLVAFAVLAAAAIMCWTYFYTKEIKKDKIKV